MDNTTAVANINNLGSTKSPLLNGLSRSIWDWCIMHNIHISAESVPGSCNVIADNFSREDSARLEWSLNNSIFNKLIDLVFKPDIDLFASRLNKKLPMFVSWYPEPGCYAVNAFNISWSNFKCYAFPPFCLLPRVLAKVQADSVDKFLLIAPIWPTQNWYLLLLDLSVNCPILLPRMDRLLYLPHSSQLHPLRKKLHLAAWILSANSPKRETFLSKQQTWCLRPGLKEQRSNMNLFGKNGAAGVLRGKLIHLRDLQSL